MNTGTISITEIVDGVKVIDKTVTSRPERPDIISILATITPVFLISNIPTIIFLAIYFACREKIKLRTELDKMNIQDLE